jgi:hypothetical protein
MAGLDPATHVFWGSTGRFRHARNSPGMTN